MSTKLYPRFGCSFCTVNRDKKEQIMTHLDEHIPEVTKHMGHPTRPSGNHFIPLLRAVRRRSGRQGNNALIQLTESEYDQCLNWRLYEIIRSEGEFTKYIRRKQRSQAEWKAAAIAFLRSDEADDAAVDNRALWDSYSPDWSNTAKGEDDEDDDGEEAWEKYVVSAATWRDISGVNSYVGNRSGPPGKSYIDDGEMNARVSGFEYPVMSNNGKYTVHHESTGLMKHTGKVNWTESPPDKTTAKADGMAKLMEADSGSDQGPRLAARRSKANAQSKKKVRFDDPWLNRSNN